MQPNGGTIGYIQVSEPCGGHHMRARPMILVRSLALTPTGLEAHLICYSTVRHAVPCCATRIIDLVDLFFFIETNDLLTPRLAHLMLQPILNFEGEFHFLTYPVGRLFGMPQKILVELEEGIFHYCSDRQGTDTLEHIVEAFHHVTCHVSVSETSFVVST
jgi:hypothetical protein